MQLPTVEERRFRSFDGTDLAYHLLGDGPPVLLANGLGGSWRAWSHQLAYFGERRRFISWDYRGLYRSSPPNDRVALRVEDHARDGLAVLDELGIDEVELWGWSMGVQVGLELYSLAPERLTSLTLLNGVPGAPWESALRLPRVGAAIPGLLGAMRVVPWAVQGMTE